MAFAFPEFAAGLSRRNPCSQSCAAPFPYKYFLASMTGSARMAARGLAAGSALGFGAAAAGSSADSSSDESSLAVSEELLSEEAFVSAEALPPSGGFALFAGLDGVEAGAAAAGLPEGVVAGAALEFAGFAFPCGVGDCWGSGVIDELAGACAGGVGVGLAGGPLPSPVVG